MREGPRAAARTRASSPDRAQIGEDLPMPPPSRQEEVQAWLRTSFGVDWAAHIHHKHKLVAAEPLLYCSACGRFASGRRHLRKLTEVCLGKPPENTTYFAYRRYLKQGKHPSHMKSGKILHAMPVAVQAAGGRDQQEVDPDLVAPLRKARKCAA